MTIFQKFFISVLSLVMLCVVGTMTIVIAWYVIATPLVDVAEATTPTPEPTGTPTSTLIPTATPTPKPPTLTPSPTPIPPTATPTSILMPEIKTSGGVLVIKEVQLSDRVPPGCDAEDISCDRVLEGYQVLIIWLERKDKGDPMEIDPAFKFLDQEIYVVSDDGSRTEISLESASRAGVSSFFLVAFTPKISERNFKLFWPGNQPIDLGQ